jgi:hypothetical protein
MEQTEQGQGYRGFSTSGLAHESERFPGVDLEGNVSNGPNRRRSICIRDAQMTNIQEWNCHGIL